MPGEALPAVDDDYRAFEATFPFDETPDQASAIADVARDLEQPRPMDRLVCGDVGFGKTEVAIRAAFRVAAAGRQVAVLCPTTVLAQQHWLTFQARMTTYPIQVAVLSRFQTKQEQAETVRGLRDGTVDIVIGTHRLLSKDVHFKRLGLLVVDEEQRFGVTHKERIKQLKRSVDVLTLTATPIPRTLQMAVSGLRDMSLITTPPVDRRAIRTIVTRSDDAVIREAIRRELARGGQVFYVYNRVDGIHERAPRVQTLVPEARIAVGHGQMSEATLEQTMLDFVEGRYDVLVATAIIESGLDIPRANTIIIDRADIFGLAQLYQLRGRVGRSKERAYCYLVVPPPSAMTRRGARPHRGARAPHRARLRLPDRVARPRAARRRRPPGRRAERQRRPGRLRALLPDARRGRARAARRAGRARGRTGALVRRRGALARRLHRRRRRAPLALQAPRQRGKCGRGGRSRDRDGGPLRPAARRGASGSST